MTPKRSENLADLKHLRSPVALVPRRSISLKVISSRYSQVCHHSLEKFKSEGDLRPDPNGKRTDRQGNRIVDEVFAGLKEAHPSV